jgi:hypothetical protein
MPAGLWKFGVEAQARLSKERNFLILVRIYFYIIINALILRILRTIRHHLEPFHSGLLQEGPFKLLVMACWCWLVTHQF